MKAARSHTWHTPPPVQPPDVYTEVVTLQLSSEEAERLRAIMGCVYTIPAVLEKEWPHNYQSKNVAEFMASVRDALEKAGVKPIGERRGLFR